jgi:hypothetical protein
MLQGISVSGHICFKASTVFPPSAVSIRVDREVRSEETSALQPARIANLMMNFDLDLLLINPSGRQHIYQKLRDELTAVEHGWALPERWTGFSQHSYDCLPLPTEKLAAAKVLTFRDEAFHRYFANKRYLDVMTQKFDWDTRKHVEDMARQQLRCQIVEEWEAGTSTRRAEQPAA